MYKNRNNMNSGKSCSDFSKFLGSVAGIFVSAKNHMDQFVREKFEDYARKMRLVSNQEFDAIKSTSSKLLKEQEELKERLHKIESHKKVIPKKAVKKPATKTKSTTVKTKTASKKSKTWCSIYIYNYDIS